MAETFSVPVLSIVCAAASAVLALGVPLVLAALCARRQRGALRCVGVGAACFVLAVLVLESAVNALVMGRLFPALAQDPAGYVLYGCLASGLFEESARFIGLRVLCRRQTDVGTGFAYGVGHGGAEAVLVGALGALNNAVTLALLNGGSPEVLLAGVPAEQLPLAQQQLAALAATPALTFLAGGLERMVAMALHIALSVLVWMVVTHRLPAWGLAVSMLLHALVNVPAALYQVGVLRGIWLTESCVLAATAAVCAGVWRAYRRSA